MKHFLLLVNEFLHILWTCVFRKLNAAASNVHGCRDVAFLLTVEAGHCFFGLSWGDVGIFDSPQRGSGGGCIFVPNHQLLSGFLRFLLLYLFSFTSHKYFFVIGGSKGRTGIGCSFCASFLLWLLEISFLTDKASAHLVNTITHTRYCVHFLNFIY